MAASQPAKPKRRIKNPETFRERAVKAAEASDEPKRTTPVKQASVKFASVIFNLFRPVVGVLSKILSLKPFAWLGKVLRLIGKIIFPAYFRQSWRELRQVTWPNWKQSRQLTFAVMVFAIIFGAAIAVVDYGLDKVFRNVLLK